MPEKFPKFDINELKNNIEAQKKELHTKQIAMGQGNGQVIKSNKRTFLNELKDVLKTGGQSEAVAVIQAVNETVEQKRGVPQAVAKNKKSYAPPRSQQYVNEQYQSKPVRTGASDWGMNDGNVSIPQQQFSNYDDREMMFEQNLQNANATFDQMMMKNNPVVAGNPRMQTMMQQYNQPHVVVQQPQQYIVEQPQVGSNDIITEKLEKNLEKMVESTFKSVLTNIYTRDKIYETLKEILQTDEGLKLVGRAINEIASRKKK